jgi:hypothetical protein
VRFPNSLLDSLLTLPSSNDSLPLAHSQLDSEPLFLHFYS